MIANDATKGCADKSGNSRAVTYFKVLALGLGEKVIEEKLIEKRLYAKAGQMLCMSELDADMCKRLAIFDIINTNPDTKDKFKNGTEQAEYLKLQAK